MPIEIDKSRKAFLSGYNNISVKRAGVLTCPYPKLGARLEVTCDLEPLFPFINGNVAGVRYFDNPERIQSIFDGVQCTLYSCEIIAAAFNDHDHALSFGENLLSFLNELFVNKNSIKPNYRRSKHLSVIDIYKILPKSNCRECGFQSCLAFAGALCTGEAIIDQCPTAGRPIEEKVVYPVLDSDGRLTSTVEFELPERDYYEQKQQELKSVLTERELQVLQLVAQGFTNPEISEELFISPHTVKTHVVHIYEKLGVNDRAQAAVLASRYNLI
jgi:DNA-binding CsgD family transcriptional regulator/ArsR family metal-binding transcriptional regulator